MLRHLSVAVLAGSVVVGRPTTAAAQSAGCEEAAARVATRTLPRSGSPEWNDWVTLTGCGSRGATVIAGALRADGIRTETELGRLDYLAGILDGWFQPQLVSAYDAVLRSPDASNGMRLRTMWLLSGLYAPDVEVAGPLQGYMALRCERYDRSTALRDAPATLPAAAYDQARAAVAFAGDDRTVPEYVRTTARCWEAVISDELRHGTREVPDADRDRTVVVRDEPEVVVVERPVRVVYECGTRFVFYNDAGYDLAVRYDGFGKRGVLRVAHGGPYVWAAARFGPVRFWVGDREVWYTDAVYRPCGGTRVIVAPAVHIWTGWHIGLGVYVGSHRVNRHVVRPVVVRPVVVRPRVTRPVIIVNPRGDDGRHRPEPWIDGRTGRRDESRDNPRPAPRTGGRVDRGTDEREVRTAQPRGDGGARQPRQPPTRQGDRDGGVRRSQPSAVPARGEQAAPSRGTETSPLPRSPRAGRERFAVPRSATPPERNEKPRTRER